MKKIYIIGGIVVGVLLTAAATFLITNYFFDKKTEQLTSQIATLNSSLDAIGPITTCYTVNTATFPGQEITEDNLQEQSIPNSFVTESFALEDIAGKFSKVAITPGTPITVDMLMSEQVIDSVREIDITGNRWPIGLKEGDYVDLRITYPRGEDFIVLSHKRVYSIVNQTLKVHMTEEEQVLYQAALVDFYLSKHYGSDLYLTKYVEPGIQNDAVPFYSVPVRIATAVRLDPNIVNAAEVSVKEEMRATIEAARQQFALGDESGSYIQGGRDDLNSKVNSDYTIKTYETKEQQEAAAAAEADGGESLTSGVEGGVE